MKNKDIVLLVQAGILELTTLCLSSGEAYGFFKLRKSLRSAYDRICSDEQEMLSMAGVTDLQAFAARLDALKKVAVPSYSESLEMDNISRTLSDYTRLRAKLLDDDVDVKPCPLAYEKWRALQCENKEKSHLFGKAEELLEGILWAAPDDNQ